MGNAQSENHRGDMAPGTRMRLPMPEPEELEKKFNKVLVSATAFGVIIHLPANSSIENVIK